MGPLVFTPYFRPQIWGGRRLESKLHKALPPEGKFGESWEISVQPHHVSVIAEGEHAGRTLVDLWNERRAELVGDFSGTQFPLLVKLLDCQELLSVQVHPDDALAQEILGQPNGKTEAWIVLHAEPAGVIYAGFKPGTDPDVLRRALKDGTVADHLHSFSPKPGDCLFVPAGLVHAVGGGVVMAEVQQTSDATFRMFDWNRVDPATGKGRDLHVEESIKSIRFDLAPGRPADGASRESLPPGIVGAELVRCPFFRLDRFKFLPLPLVPPFLPITGAQSGGRGSIWMVLEGAAVLEGVDYYRRFRAGETVLVPASAGPLAWRPASTHEQPQSGSPVLLRAVW